MRKEKGSEDLLWHLSCFMKSMVIRHNCSEISLVEEEEKKLLGFTPLCDLRRQDSDPCAPTIPGSKIVHIQFSVDEF